MSREPIPWRLVVPVQRVEAGKTRLRAPAGVDHAALARAVAQDTLTAVCGALPPGRAIVVTSDPTIDGYAVTLGGRVVPDPGAGLNAAVRAGLEAAACLVPGVAVGGDASARDPGARDQAPVGVLLGDLPALRPQDLLAALSACEGYPRAVVPDAAGTGTVLLTSLAGDLDPSFGVGSAERHGRSAHRLELDLPRLRRDVDTLADLADASRLGVGPSTLRVLRAAEPRLDLE